MPLVDTDKPETPAPPARDDAAGGRAVGRRLLGAGVAGLAASLMPGLATRVGATTPDTTDDTTADTVPDQGSTPKEGEDSGSGSTENVTVVPTGPTPDETDPSTPDTGAATTTTEAARRPTQADVAPLGFMQQVETAIVALYDSALAREGLDETSRSVLSAIRESHQGYGQAVGAMLGQAAPEKSETTSFTEFELGLGDGSIAEIAEIAEAAYRVEAIALATHLDLIGKLEATDGGRLLASIAVMEARHCTVLSHLAGRTGLDSLELPDVEPLVLAEA